MIVRQLATWRLLLLAADGLAASVLFAVVSIVRFGDAWREAWLQIGAPWWAFALGYGFMWFGAEWLMQLDLPQARWRLRGEIVDIVRAVLLLAVSVFSVLFLIHVPEVSRQFLLLLFIAQIAFAVGQRLLLRVGLAALRGRGVGTRHVLVVGTGEVATWTADRLERHRELGFRVIGHLGEAAVGPRPVLGPIAAIEDVIHGHVVDEVVLCLDADERSLVEPLVALCQQEGKVLRVPLADAPTFATRGRTEMLDDIEFLAIISSPDRVIELIAKRGLDILVSALVLIVGMPLMAAIAIAVRAGDGGPVLFRQTRVGLHGRPFTMTKFRTMIPGAEARLAELIEVNEVDGHAFKLQDDPRVTRVGAFLRRTSLDELPQFWNVLRGQMSVVGPRPPLPIEVAGYDVWHRRRLSMKPGITGLWQVSARLEKEFDRWVELDLSYIDRWSLALDIKIMVRTIPAMLHGR